MQETILVDDLCRGLWILVVALHHVETSAAHLTLHTHGTFLVGLWVEHFHFHERIVAANSGATLLERVVQTSLCHTRRTLGQSIDAGDSHKHLLRDAFHQFHWAERACHDSSTETTHVEHVEHRVIQFSNEHCGHTIDGRTTFLMDGGKHYQRVEFLDHHLGAAVSQTVHRGQHHTEAVE